MSNAYSLKEDKDSSAKSANTNKLNSSIIYCTSIYLLDFIATN